MESVRQRAREVGPRAWSHPGSAVGVRGAESPQRLLRGRAHGVLDAAAENRPRSLQPQFELGDPAAGQGEKEAGRRAEGSIALPPSNGGRVPTAAPPPWNPTLAAAVDDPPEIAMDSWVSEAPNALAGPGSTYGPMHPGTFKPLHTHRFASSPQSSLIPSARPRARD